jgi:lysophospholipase L1-like esterase
MTTPRTPLPGDGLLDVEERKVHVELRGEAEVDGYPRGTFRQAVTAMATLVMAIAATYVVPRWHWARPWTPEMDYVPFWNLVGRELLGEGAETEVKAQELAAAQELARDEVAAEEVAVPFVDREVRAPVQAGETLPAYAGHAEDQDRVEQPLEQPEALDPFYAALAASELGYAGAVTRVMHYGDSAIGNDGIPGAIRMKMQQRFGDAGHGFHLLGQPNASYRHQGVRFEERSAFNHCFIIFGCRERDGHYGLGGTTFESTGGAEVRLGTATRGAMGRKVSRFEVWYAGAPRGGDLRLQLDAEAPVVLPTAADALEDRWHVIETTDGEHTLSIRAAGGGKVRAYGAVLERDVPGVVWDEMSQIGALTRRLLNFDAEHLHSQIRRRDPDLVVFMFGGNDMNTQGTMAKYRQEFTDVIRLFRGAKDPLPCLVMAPLDHGERDGARIVTRDIVPRLVNAQREVARAEGCAFFDTYQAMGGEGSMGRWVRSSPALGSGDLSHLTHHGHKVVGGMLYRSLVAGYRDYRERSVGAPVKLPTPRPGATPPSDVPPSDTPPAATPPAATPAARPVTPPPPADDRPVAAPPGGPAAAAQEPAAPPDAGR